jgi:DNA polymerase III epsilon subunit-like protein
MKIVIFDFEATGLDTETAEPIELGLAVYDFASQRLIKSQSELMYHPSYPQITPKIQRLTNISLDHLMSDSILPHDGILKLAETIQKYDGIAGHNIKGYDLKILERLLIKYFDLPIQTLVHNKLVIDTMTDLPYPLEIKRRDLVSLAAHHGFLNPFPHRALPDAMSTMKLMSLYPFDEVKQLAREPLIRLVPYDDVTTQYEDIREMGFRKDNLIGWFKEVKSSRIALEMAECPFKFVHVSELKTYQAMVSYQDREIAKQAKFKWEPQKRIWFKIMPESIAAEYPSLYGFNVEEI